MNQQTSTDERLLAIIYGGRALHSAVDPEGVSCRARADIIVIDVAGWRWKLRLLFGSYGTLWLQGSAPEGRSLVIDTIRMRTEEDGGTDKEIPCAPSETLLKSLGDLGGVPACLRRLLASPGPENALCGQAGKKPFDLRAYSRLIDDALAWGVDVQDVSEPLKPFAMRKVTFPDDGMRAEFSAVCTLAEGRIVMSADADVHGLGNKRVALEKNLGMMRKAIVECRDRHDGRSRPSLRAAFDLYVAIPVLYGDERNVRKDTGIPGKESRDDARQGTRQMNPRQTYKK